MAKPSSRPDLSQHANELDIGVCLGIPIKKMRDLRPASAMTLPRKGVFWPLADAQALARSMEADFTPPQKNAPQIESLTVVSVGSGQRGQHFPNKNVIKGRRINGEVVLVRVVDSAKYRTHLRIGGKPMLVQARPADDGNWWVHIGREPRWPGQW